MQLSLYDFTITLFWPSCHFLYYKHAEIIT